MSSKISKMRRIVPSILTSWIVVEAKRMVRNAVPWTNFGDGSRMGARAGYKSEIPLASHTVKVNLGTREEGANEGLRYKWAPRRNLASRAVAGCRLV